MVCCREVNVIGFYGHSNVGDESYKLAFPKLFPNYNFHFSDKITNPDWTTILGGGNVCSDHFLTQANLAKKKYAISVGGIDSRLENFDGVYVRDEQKIPNSILIPDLAFCLEPERERGIELLKNLFNGRDLYEKKIGVIINSYLCVGDSNLARDEALFQYFSYNLARIMDNTNASFIFIPFGTNHFDDRIPNSWISGKCKWWKKNLVIFEQFCPQTTLNIVSACDAVISMRLHSSIFSTISNVPFAISLNVCVASVVAAKSHAPRILARLIRNTSASLPISVPMSSL